VALQHLDLVSVRVLQEEKSSHQSAIAMELLDRIGRLKHAKHENCEPPKNFRWVYFPRFGGRRKTTALPPTPDMLDVRSYFCNAPLNEPARAGGCVLLGLRVYFSMDEGVNDRG